MKAKLESLSKEKDSNRKLLRYVRWGVKLAFLIIFIAPIKIFIDSLCSPPVYSLVYGGFAQPLFTVPYGESVCCFLLFKWQIQGPGDWIACPLGGSQVLATFGMSPVANPDILFYSTLLISAVSIVSLLIFFFGAMFCSWVCPVGTVVDSFDKAVERFMPKLNKRREERLRQSRKKEEQIEQSRKKRGYFCPTCFIGRLFNSKHASFANGIIVTALVGSAIFRFPVFCTLCPIGVLSRGMFHLKSWTHILNEGALSRTMFRLKPWTRVVDEGLLNVKNAFGVIDMPVMVEFVLIIPTVAVLLSLREKRYWCRKICPLGAVIKFVSKLNPFMKPVKGDNCICPPDYKACKKACPQALGPQKSGSAECTKCFECYVTCKNNNVRIKRFETPDAILSLKRFFKNRIKKPIKVKEAEVE